MRKATLSTPSVVRAKPGHRSRGWLVAGPLALPVALGRGGIKANKREGDGGTPRGTFRLGGCGGGPTGRRRPRTPLPVRRIRPDDGWCEDPARPALQPADRVCRPAIPATGCGAPTRLYDCIIELDHNTRPRIAGRGSAVFVHVARPGFAPTAGCVALDGTGAAPPARAHRAGHPHRHRVKLQRDTLGKERA